MRACRTEVALLFFVLSVAAYPAAGQDWQTDWAHVQRKSETANSPKRVGWLSAQIQAPAFFETTNCDFGRAALREWGFLKGSFLFVERVLRSNRLYAAQVYPARLNAANRIRDVATDYTLRPQ